MGKAARRKEQRRIERAHAPQLAQSTQSAQSKQQPLVVSYNKLRHAISWADLSTASVETVPIQPAANDAVIEAPSVKPQKKRGPKPRKAPKEVQQAALWALYADLWDFMEGDLSDKERRALQRAMARNSGELNDLIEPDTTEDSKQSRNTMSLVDEDEAYEEEEVEYEDFFADWNPDY